MEKEIIGVDNPPRDEGRKILTEERWEKVITPRRRQLLLVFLFVLVFLGLGRLLVDWSSSPSSSTTPTPSPAAVADVSAGRQVVLAGVIVPLGEGVSSLGTHRLLSEEGRVLAVLTSRKLDLDFTVPGVIVEVNGKVVKTLTDGTPLLQVESLKYRRGSEE